jgi:4-amino-4-deoxy-L-arabinose transferase-like glycosyltransferase
VRFLYIGTSCAWLKLSGRAPNLRPTVAQLKADPHGDPTMRSLHDVAAFFSCLALVLATVAAWRLGGPARGIGVAALFAFAPTQLHMSQHALVDGFFAFWALLCLWLLRENLRAPDHPGWLTALGAAMAFMVLTKENAFFAYVAFCAILAANHWLAFGKITPRLLLVMVLGPLAGVTGLVALAGGLPDLIATYQLSVSKNFTLDYAIKTGDGPWYRYLIELVTVSPIVTLLAFGEMFRVRRDDRPQLFLLIFIAASYLIMCNLKYGMNLRYTNMWDMPLRFLAFSQLAALCARLPRRRELALAIATAGICALEFSQFCVFTVQGKLYELVPEGLLNAIKVLKP